MTTINGYAIIDRQHIPIIFEAKPNATLLENTLAWQEFAKKTIRDKFDDLFAGVTITIEPITVAQ